MRNNLIPILIIILFLQSCWSFGLPDPHSLKYNERSFNALANDIVSQNKIYEMDDFTRYTKKLNGAFIRLTKEKSDNEPFDHTQFIDSVLDSLKIEKDLVNDFRKRLESTELRSFYKSGDSILFVVDGFLDNAWGYFYCRRGLSKDSSYFNFYGNYVRFVEDVNSNWKKVAIH